MITEESTKRFWRLDNTMVEDGVYYYVDPREIVAVNFGDAGSNNCRYCIHLRNGESFDVTDKDGEKLMRWAESQSEQIPEPAVELAWR